MSRMCNAAPWIACFLVVACIRATTTAAAADGTASTPPHPDDFRPPPGSKQTTGTFTVVHPAIQELTKCLESANQTIVAQGCYERALSFNQLNHSWWASLALVYLRSEQLTKAQDAMQTSLNMWLTANREFLAEAGKKRNLTEMPYSLLLRDVFDDGNGTRREEAVELGMMIAKKFELEGKVTDAHNIYYEFLLQAGSGQREVIDFHKRTGNVIAMAMSAEGTNETSFLWRLSESMAPAVEGFTESTMRLGKLDEPIRRMCGISITHTDEFRGADVVAKMASCISSWGNMTRVLEAEDATLISQWTSIMQEQPVHRLASLGATAIVSEVMEFLKGKFVSGDRAGRTSLHQAAANGHTATVKALLAGLGDEAIHTEDKGRITPKMLGCGHPGYKVEFEKEVLAKIDNGGTCEGNGRERLDGEELDLAEDETGTDGEWNPKRKRPRYLHCDFDVRDAAQMTQTDLMLGYVHSGHPVLLRNSFYETDGPDRKWRKSVFNKTFGKVYIRQEAVPLADRWGLGVPNVTTVSDFLNTLDKKDGTVGDVFAEFEKHPFHTLANEWAPPTYSNRKKSDDIFLFDTDQSNALVIISKDGSHSHHKLYTQQTYHTTVYGHQEFTLLPPRFARSLKGDLSEAMKLSAFRCDVFTGDVLVIPEMWSAHWTSKANGVSMERVVFRKFKV